jgi:hypothetical protein
VRGVWLGPDVGAVVSHYVANGSQRRFGIDHIVNTIKGADEVVLGTPRSRSRSSR